MGAGSPHTPGPISLRIDSDPQRSSAQDVDDRRQVGWLHPLHPLRGQPKGSSLGRVLLASRLRYRVAATTPLYGRVIRLRSSPRQATWNQACGAHRDVPDRCIADHSVCVRVPGTLQVDDRLRGPWWKPGRSPRNLVLRARSSTGTEPEFKERLTEASMDSRTQLRSEGDVG